MIVWLAWWRAANDSSDPIISAFIQLGAIGALALVLLWFANRAYSDVKAQRDQERVRADRLEEKLDELSEQIRTQVVTALVRATEAVAQADGDHRRR